MHHRRFYAAMRQLVKPAPNASFYVTLRGMITSEFQGKSLPLPAWPFMGKALIASAVVAACCMAVGASEADFSAEVRALYTQPQRLIDVDDGRRLNLICIGEGRPTVVFDIGVGDPGYMWSRVHPAVGKTTRACVYDRAGINFSDPGQGNGSSAEIVDDLKKMLSVAGIAPPYVLVGQSYGGMNVRLYYYLYPDDVAGMVLVEPSHEGQDEGFRMLSPNTWSRQEWVALREPGRIERARCLKLADSGTGPENEEFDGCIVDPPDVLPDFLKEMYREMQYTEEFQRAQGTEETAVFAESVDQLARHRRAFGDLPLIVLSRSAERRPLRDWETPHLRQARYQMWLDLHRSLADSSSEGEWRVIPDSDHLMQLSQPDDVIAAVRDVLTKASEKL